MRLTAVLVWLALASATEARIPSAPGRVSAADTSRTVRRFTLAGTDRRMRLAAWDRRYTAGGLYSDGGTLARWPAEMDNEYDLDLFAILPTLADDAAFYAAPNGVRMSAGSIRTGRLATETEVRVSVPVTSRIGLGVRAVQQEDLSARRGAVELGYRVALSRGHGVELRHSIGELKADLDIEALYHYASPSGATAEAALGRLDGLNNLVYGTLTPSAFYTDTLRVYESGPLWLRGRVSVPVGRVRVEGAGSVAPRSRADVRSQTDPEAAFVYDNAFAWGGVLVEASVGDALSAGASVHGARSASVRESRRGRVSARQTETRIAAFATGQWRSVQVEAYAAVERRADLRDAAALYLVREQWTWARLRTDWRPGADRGLVLGAELLGGARTFGTEAHREALQARLTPAFPFGPNWRLVGRVGYRFSPQADVVLGVGLDLDDDRHFPDQDRRYDGAHLRLRAVW